MHQPRRQHQPPNTSHSLLFHHSASIHLSVESIQICCIAHVAFVNLSVLPVSSFELSTEHARTACFARRARTPSPIRHAIVTVRFVQKDLPLQLRCPCPRLATLLRWQAIRNVICTCMQLICSLSTMPQGPCSRLYWS
jgi:hypothetical protein